MSMTERTKIFLATPAYGGLCHHLYVASLVGLVSICARFGVECAIRISSGEALITRARNLLAAEFLASDATHLLFVDADQGFDPRDVLRMLRADLDVVAAIAPGKMTAWDQVADAAHAGVTDPEALRQAGASFVVNFASELVGGTREVTVASTEWGRFVEVTEAGTGVMLIKRAVLERMAEHYGDRITYAVDYPPTEAGTKRSAFFDTAIDPETRRYMSEDYLFCQRWRAMGGKVHAALDVKVTHSGTATFAGDPSTLVAPARAT